MLSLKNIHKQYNSQIVIKDLNIQLPDKGLVGIVGKSGCGKSTLLNIIASIDDHYSGQVLFNNILLNSSNSHEYISYLMQSNDYLDYLTVKENILLATQVAQKEYDHHDLEDICEKLHVAHLLNRYPNQLSGGQLKRMSLAKSLLKHAPIILLDEPTGPLDSSTSIDTMNILKEISKECLVIVVSHDILLTSQYADILLKLENQTIQYTTDIVSNDHLITIAKKHYSLLHVPLKQLFKDRYKYLVLVLFEVFIFICVFLLITCLNGISKSIDESVSQSVMSHVLTISSSSDQPLNISDFKNVRYSYDTSLINISCNNQNISSTIYFLPNDTSHIKLSSGSLPTSENEILVSSSFLESLTSSQIYLSYGDTKIEVTISGVTESMFIDENAIYLNNALKDIFNNLKNENEIEIETKQPLKDYQKYSKKYQVFNNAIDTKNNYASLIKAIKIVGIIFVIISELISMMLIHEVTQVICLTHVHDYAYLQILGMRSNKLVITTLLTSLFLGIFISFMGIIGSSVIYNLVNSLSILSSKYYFDLVLNKIWLCRYDLYFVLFIIYTLFSFICAIKPTLEVLNTDLISVIREE